jgi:transposase
MSALYVGIDIGKRKHEATVLNAEGDQLGRSLVFDNSQQGVAKLLDYVGKFAVEQIVYGLEATGHYWLALYAALTARDCEVKVINPIQSDSLRNLYIRVTKNDRKDSFLVAEVLRFGRFTETRLADEPMIQLRELSRMRVEFANALASLKRRILGILDRIFPEFERCFSNPFGRTALEVLGRFLAPVKLAECDLVELTELIKTVSRGRLGVAKARQLQEAEAQSFGISLGLDAFTLELRLLVEQLQFIQHQIDELSTAIEELMQAHQLILSIPGVGPVLGAAILGEIGDINRFASAKKLRAYAGLDPTVYQSGEFEGSRARLSKRGSPYLRRALWMAASVARLHDPTFRAFYETKLAQGKHPNRALGAVASKLCSVIFAVLSKNELYDPNYRTRLRETT